MPPKEPIVTTPSGTSNSGFISYPRILDLEDIPEIHGQYIYILHGYEENGLCVLIHRNRGQVVISAADWDANAIDPSEEGELQEYFKKFIVDNSINIINFMVIADIPKALFYITIDKKQDKLTLTDVRLSLNKFVGPGALRDFFGKFIHTQDVIEIVSLNDSLLQSIQEKRGRYNCDLMLKTSRFKTIVRDAEMLPLYARIKRNA